MKENLSRMWRSGLALLLALVLVVGMCPVTAFAAEEDTSAKLEAALKDLLTKVEELAPSVSGRLYDYTVERGYVADVADAYNAVKAEVEAAKKTFVEEDAPVVENAIALLNEQIDLLNSELDTLEEVTDIAEIKSKIAQMESNVADLQAALDAGYEAMDALENALVAVDGNIASLKAVMTNPGKGSVEELAASLKDTKNAVVNAVKDVIDAATQLPTILDNLSEMTVATAGHATNLVDTIVADLQSIFDNLQAENDNEYDSKISAAIQKFEDAKAAVDAEVNAQVTALNDEYSKYLDEANADLNAAMAEMEAKIDEAQKELKAKADELQAKADALQADADALQADADAWQAQADALKAELETAAPENAEALQAEIDALEAKADDLKAQADVLRAEADELEAEVEDLKDQIQAKADEIEAIYKDALNELEATANEAVTNLKSDLAAKVKAVEDAGAEKIAALKAACEDEVKALKEKMEAELDKTDKDEAAVAAAKAKVAALKDAIKNEVGPSIDNAAEALTASKITAKGAAATIKELAVKLEAAVKKMVYNATHDNVNKGQYGYYVAMGDEAANTEMGYVDIVAGRIGNGYAPGQYFAEYGENITKSYALVEECKDQIAASDLITIDFSSNVFMKYAVKQMFAPGANNWALYVGETGEDIILEALAIVEKLLKEAGADETAQLMNFIECYAYSYITYAYNMPFVVNAIREYNADAAVLLVGMHNSMEGVTLTIGGKALPLGKCVNILVDAANAYTLGYAALTGNAVYVHAPAVEVEGTNKAYDVLSFANYLVNVEGAFLPTNNGHIYIAEQILKALNIEWVDEGDPIYRLSGNNRYLTALEVAYDMEVQLGVDKFDTILIASGLKYPDSLAGSYLADTLDAPILLADPEDERVSKYYAPVLSYVKENLNVGGTVYILGGPNTVPESVATDMGEFGNVIRLGGKNRWETCLKILEEAAKFDPAAATAEVLVCAGDEEKWADSLAASAVGKPVLLIKGTNVSGLSDAQIAYLTGKDYVIIGGESTVTPAVADKLDDIGNFVTRLGGKNRAITSVMIANYYFPGNTKIELADGRKFPDSLSGGPLANVIGAPIILALPTEYAASLNAAVDYVAAKGLAKGVIVGGDASVSDEIACTIFGIPTYDIPNH